MEENMTNAIEEVVEETNGGSGIGTGVKVVAGLGVLALLGLGVKKGIDYIKAKKESEVLVEDDFEDCEYVDSEVIEEE